jgi:hypothetical protein
MYFRGGRLDRYYRPPGLFGRVLRHKSKVWLTKVSGCKKITNLDFSQVRQTKVRLG